MTIAESIIFAFLFVLGVILVLKYIPLPKDETELREKIEAQGLLIRQYEEEVKTQKGIIRNLEAQYRKVLEEVAEVNRTSRLQAETNSVLKKQIRELREMMGMTNDSLMILGVWPYPEKKLNTYVEEIAIYNAGFEYRSLREQEATKEEIARELQRHPYFLLEVGSHGSSSEIQLYDDIARPGWWARLVRNHDNLQVVLLVACESDSVGDALIAAGVPVVVSIQRNIPDEHAGRFVRNFYEQLAKKHRTVQDVANAVDYAKHTLPESSAVMIRFRSTVLLEQELGAE